MTQFGSDNGPSDTGVKSNHVLFLHGGSLICTVTAVKLLGGMVTLVVSLAIWVAVSSITLICMS